MYCEAESKSVVQSDPPCEPFNLCLWCFSNAFPEHHDHPRSSFATKVIVGPKGVRPVKGGIITRFEKDVLDLEYKEPEKPAAPIMSAEDQLNAMMSLDNDQSYVYLDQWRERKVCAFCNDEGTANKDPFIGPYPFLLASTNRYGDAKKKNFWAHDACARHSPEVIQGKDGTWYNVSMAMRRGRTVVRQMPVYFRQRFFTRNGLILILLLTEMYTVQGKGCHDRLLRAKVLPKLPRPLHWQAHVPF